MPTKNILLIDHDPSVREVLQTCLQYLGGWDVISVASMQEGLEQLSTLCPDAIVLDVFAPQTDGFAFTQFLKKNSKTQSIPILFITSKASWFTPQQLEDLGVAGAIAKPFNPTLLPSQISRLLGWTMPTSV